MLRTSPSLQSDKDARGHDLGMGRVTHTLMAHPRDRHDQEVTHNIVSLLMRMGGLDLRRALRIAPAAHWASWDGRSPSGPPEAPNRGDNVVRKLPDREDAGGCPGELLRSGNSVGQAGFFWQA